MKSKTPFVLLGILMGSLVVACGPSQVELDATSTQIASDIFATQTAGAPTITPTFTLTPSPTPTSTSTPTITPTPSPDLSKANLSLKDLPLGFESFPPEDLNLQPGANFISGGTIESSFGFSIEAEEFEIIAGATTLIPNKLERAEFDLLLPEIPELIFGVMEILMGTEDLVEAKDIRDLENFGEIGIGVSSVFDSGGIRIRWDVILFRRGQVGVLTYVMYMDGDVPLVPVDDVATLMDDRIAKEFQDELIQWEPPYFDDFSDLTSGWEVGEYDYGTVGYKGGVYVVTSTDNETPMWGIANQSFEDVEISVQAKQVSGPTNNNNGYGVGCRVGRGLIVTGYYFLISGDGYFAIFREEEDSSIELVPWTESDFVHQGNDINSIRAVCNGEELSLYINGELGASVIDTVFGSGDIALSAISFEDEDTEIHFDDFELKRP